MTPDGLWLGLLALPWAAAAAYIVGGLRAFGAEGRLGQVGVPVAWASAVGLGEVGAALTTGSDPGGLLAAWLVAAASACLATVTEAGRDQSNRWPWPTALVLGAGLGGSVVLALGLDAGQAVTGPATLFLAGLLPLALLLLAVLPWRALGHAPRHVALRQMLGIALAAAAPGVLIVGLHPSSPTVAEASWVAWLLTLAGVSEAAAVLLVLRAVQQATTEARIKQVQEQAREQAQNQFATLLDTVDGIVAGVDGQGVVRWMSPGVKRMMGYEPEAVTGRPIQEFLLPGDLENVQRKLGDLKASPGTALHTVQRIRHRDGTDRLFQIRGRDLRHHPGYGVIVLHLQDITEAQALQLALQESQARLEEACRIAGIGWWQHTLDTDRITCSDTLLGLLGWEDLPGAVWSELRLRLIHPDDLGRVEEAMARAAVTRQKVRVEHRVMRADGQTRDWLAHIRGVRDETGRLLHLSSTVADITEERQQMVEMLHRDKLEALELLAAGIAHDFNNLLTTITGNISLVRTLAGDDVVAAALKDAEEASRRASQLARQLLQYGTGDGVRTESTRLGRLLADTVPFLLHGTRVEGRVIIGEGIDEVPGDAGELLQVIQNLVLNAVDAMPGGGSLEVRAARVTMPEDGPGLPLASGGYVLIEVEDRGVGIPPEHMARIFDPYFTTRDTGHGLGLATVHRIVRRQEGYISVASVPGQGTTFRVYWPAPEAVAASRGRPTQGDRRPNGVRVPSHIRVLVADDDDAVRQAAVRMMRELGHEAEAAADSSEALALMRRAVAEGRPYQLALVDLTMPGDKDGVSLFRELKGVNPLVCGILTTGYVRHESMVHHQVYGFQAALAKPYGMAELAAALQRLNLP
jgi:PAS domain S-box-containing protein